MKKYICFMDFEYTTTGDKKRDSDNGVEVISMAGVVVNEKLETVDEFYKIVRPIKNVVIHPYCTELTGITQEMVDSADFFGRVADDFMEFIEEYEDCELSTYVWGDYDEYALEKTFDITRYSGDFTIFKDSIIDIQRRISSSIKYKGNTIRDVIGLQYAKVAFGLPVSKNAHNALYDAKDLRDLYISYKLRKPKNFEFIKWMYEKSLSHKITSRHGKGHAFNFIPGEIKYGLANLFKNTSNVRCFGASEIQFNKKTMLFKDCEHFNLPNDDKSNVLKMDTGIVRYSNTQLVTEIKKEKIMISGVEVENVLFSLRFATKSRRNGSEYLITPSFDIPIIPRNVRAIDTFLKKINQYISIYGIKEEFNDQYGLNTKSNGR